MTGNVFCIFCFSITPWIEETYILRISKSVQSLPRTLWTEIKTLKCAVHIWFRCKTSWVLEKRWGGHWVTELSNWNQSFKLGLDQEARWGDQYDWKKGLCVPYWTDQEMICLISRAKKLIERNCLKSIITFCMHVSPTNYIPLFIITPVVEYLRSDIHLFDIVRATRTNLITKRNLKAYIRSFSILKELCLFINDSFQLFC